MTFTLCHHGKEISSHETLAACRAEALARGWDVGQEPGVLILGPREKETAQ